MKLGKSHFFLNFVFKFSNNPEKLNLLLPLTIEKLYVSAKEEYLIFTTCIRVRFVISFEKTQSTIPCPHHSRLFEASHNFLLFSFVFSIDTLC